MLGAVLKSFRPNSGLSSAISDDGRGKTMKFICENVFTTGRTSKNLSGAGDDLCGLGRVEESALLLKENET